MIQEFSPEANKYSWFKQLRSWVIEVVNPVILYQKLLTNIMALKKPSCLYTRCYAGYTYM